MAHFKKNSYIILNLGCFVSVNGHLIQDWRQSFVNKFWFLLKGELFLKTDEIAYHKMHARLSHGTKNKSGLCLLVDNFDFVACVTLST